MARSQRQAGTLSRLAVGLLLAGLVAGCAVGPDYRRPEDPASSPPAAWHARLPHGGERVALARWWDGFGDPLLAELVDQAQQSHPSIDAALAGLRESRAQLEMAQSTGFPRVTGSASQTRSDGGTVSTSGVDIGPITRGSAGLDAAWEIDLFGGTRRSIEASQSRATAGEWKWHEARVSLAAEVAGTYVARRQCERLLDIAGDALQSRQESVRMTRQRVDAGFNAPADAAQAEAAFAESQGARLQQQGQCALNLNQLVALTGLDAATLGAKLAVAPALLPLPTTPSVPGVPTDVLSQRPDVAASERALNAASAEIGVAIADRLPSLTLGGAIGANRLRVGGQRVIDHTWSFGPSIAVPLFDGGRGAAGVEAARARYDHALASYRSQVVQAVREVEDALVRLDTAVSRQDSAATAEHRYADLLASAEQRYLHGAISLLALEETRRLALGSRQALAGVQTDISQAWIALYKSVGGGWQDAATPADVAAAP